MTATLSATAPQQSDRSATDPLVRRGEPIPIEPVPNPAGSAKAAGLRYVTDQMPGIRRQRDGDSFTYIASDGKVIRDPSELARIKALGIPPAWTDVWICLLANGHLQATGRDVKGRKQHRYHPRWREVRDQTKYDRMISFAVALPRIRQRVAEDLALPGMPRQKVLAAVVRLLETTMIRVGNEEYVRANHHYGLTTMRNRHVDVAGATLRFHFTGKSGKKHVAELHDRRLARIVKRCREIPGHHLFEYLDEHGQCRAIGSGDVNDYLREISGHDFTAKEFRTWAGTLLAVRALRDCGVCESVMQGKKNIVHAIDAVTERLGNTRAVCRKYYVHPAVLESYLDGSLRELCQVVERAGPPGEPRSPPLSGELGPEEAAVLSFLRQRAAHEALRGEERAASATTTPAAGARRRRGAAAARPGGRRRQTDARARQPVSAGN